MEVKRARCFNWALGHYFKLQIISYRNYSSVNWEDGYAMNLSTKILMMSWSTQRLLTISMRPSSLSAQSLLKTLSTASLALSIARRSTDSDCITQLYLTCFQVGSSKAKKLILAKFFCLQCMDTVSVQFPAIHQEDGYVAIQGTIEGGTNYGFKIIKNNQKKNNGAGCVGLTWLRFVVSVNQQ